MERSLFEELPGRIEAKEDEKGPKEKEKEERPPAAGRGLSSSRDSPNSAAG